MFSNLKGLGTTQQEMLRFFSLTAAAGVGVHAYVLATCPSFQQDELPLVFFMGCCVSLIPAYFIMKVTEKLA